MNNFIASHTYDIRKTGNGRWIDQKCTMDELCFVADCVVVYLQEGGEQPFQSPDIWHTDYAIENVQNVFCKPDPTDDNTIDEYNKFFRQPLKMLAAAGVLKEEGKNPIKFSVENKAILEYLSLRERNCMDFLCSYIEKTLKDSGLWDSFESFFDEQTPERYNEVKDQFVQFCLDYTPMNQRTEPRRIFTKVLNPLAIKYKKKGSEKGHLSKNIITVDKIKYNRTNFRDKDKDKNISRGDAAAQQAQKHKNDVYNYEVTKAKRRLKMFNDRYNSGRSEIVDRFSIGETATHMHHIFPQSSFPEIATYVENLIALTSGQHLQVAHPKGNTNTISKDYQYTCLINKTENIRKNIMDDFGEPIYSFDDFMFVLDTGLRTDFFEGLDNNDFNSVIQGIDMNY